MECPLEIKNHQALHMSKASSFSSSSSSSSVGDPWRGSSFGDTRWRYDVMRAGMPLSSLLQWSDSQ